jgi:hypothetical protein
MPTRGPVNDRLTRPTGRLEIALFAALFVEEGSNVDVAYFKAVGPKTIVPE